MIPIIGTGLSGLVGSRVTALLSDRYTFTDLSKETHVDLMDFPVVEERISASPAQWVFHFAAYTNVQGAEDEKDQKEHSISWQVNVNATEHIAGICEKTGKHLVYISTDYVFDGTNQWYDEDAIPAPISWYGRTKYEGELRVGILGERALIIRIATPYRSNPVGKIDFVHKMRERLTEHLPVQAPSDQIFCPTFVDDLADALPVLLGRGASGVYHIVASEPVTPYNTALEIASQYGLDRNLITETSYAAYVAGKALPPQHAYLKHGKIDALGVKLHSFHEGLEMVQKQEQKG